MATPIVVVPHLPPDRPLKLSQRGRVPEQRAVLHLEPSPKRFHPRVVPRPTLTKGHHRLVLDQKLPQPTIAGVHRILIVVYDQALRTHTPPSQLGLGHLPTPERQLPVGTLPHRPARHPTAPGIQHRHQIRLPRPIRIPDLREVGAQHLKRLELFPSHQVELPLPLLQDHPHPAGPGFGYLSPQRQIPSGKKSPQPLVVHLQPVLGRKLRLDPAVPVGRMLLHHLEHLFLEPFILRADLGPPVTVPDGLGHRKRTQTPVQAVFLPVPFHQRKLLLQGQLSLKKFFRSAISTSLCPSIRSSSAILFS